MGWQGGGEYLDDGGGERLKNERCNRLELHLALEISICI